VALGEGPPRNNEGNLRADALANRGASACTRHPRRASLGTAIVRIPQAPSPPQCLLDAPREHLHLAAGLLVALALRHGDPLR